MKLLLPATVVAILVSGPALAQYNNMSDYQNHLANEALANSALKRAHGGGAGGGCNSLPTGWATLDVTVQFPANYGGYASWVNTAELLPVGSDVDSFLKSGNGPVVGFRPALHRGKDIITSKLCAPAGRAYWVIVDSGRQRIVVGQVNVSDPGGPFQVSLAAPPLKR